LTYAICSPTIEGVELVEYFLKKSEMNEQRVIFHIDMDTFFVSVERRDDPELIGKPVVVGGQSDQRGVVSAASYEARKYGIHSAMPLRRAVMLCPHAIFLNSSPKKYSIASQEVFKIIENYSPAVDKASIDEAYLDLTGCEKLLGSPLDVASRLTAEVEQKVGIAASVGIGQSRLVAKICSKLAKPRGILYVLPDQEKLFLAPLKVSAIPGVGPKMTEKLKRFGITTIGELARADREWLSDTFGKSGPHHWLRANAIDYGTVDGEEREPKSVGNERTFSEDCNDGKKLEATIYRLSEKVASRLRSGVLTGRRVTLKLRYADFSTITRARTLAQPVNGDAEIFAEAYDLFQRNYRARALVRLIGVTVSDICRCDQPQLFVDGKVKRNRKLYSAIDQARERFGYDTLRGGTGLLNETEPDREKSEKNGEDDDK
jgi:DNA polymerase IV